LFREMNLIRPPAKQAFGIIVLSDLAPSAISEYHVSK